MKQPTHTDTMKILFIALFTLALPALLLAQGTLYFSNLSQPVSGYLIGNGAQPFTTGLASNGYILNSVTILMGNWLGGASNFVVSICDDNNGQPGTSLGTLSGNSDPESAGQYIYSAQGILFTASSIYWIVGSSDVAPSSGLFPPGGYVWQLTSSSAYTSSDGWSISTVNSMGILCLQFSINATPTPEPCAFALVGLAIGLMLVMGRRSKCYALFSDRKKGRTGIVRFWGV